MKKRVISFMTAMIMLTAMTVNPVALSGKITVKSGEYKATKISHPEKGTGEVDGIVDYIGKGVVSANGNGQGDRGQNYAWSAIAKGDYVYVATCFNAMGQTLNFMDSVLGNDFDPDEMEATLNIMFNGTFYTGEPDGANTGGILVKVNVKTGEVTLLMSKSLTGQSVLFRNVCEYKGKFYFCGAVNSIPQIVQVDPETDEFKTVYTGIAPADMAAAHKQGICVTVRGLCEYNGKLVVSCVTMSGPQILISDHPWDGQTAFTEIANQQDLFDYPAYHYTDSIYGGSIWEMVSYNNKLYVSLCTGTEENKPDENSMQSFALVCGEPDENGKWSWRPVIGDKADGAKYTFGIDPERTRAGAGVLQVYNGYLYIGEYNDEQISLENILFKADFDFMNANLEQSVNLYRMDKDENIELIVGDATKMFPKGGLSGFGSGFGRNENQYIWRMAEYNGKLFVGTFDTSSLLEPIGQFSNGHFASMTPEEQERLIEYIIAFISLKNSKSEAMSIEADSETESLIRLFEEYSAEKIAEKILSNSPAKRDIAFVTLWEKIEGFLECAEYMQSAIRGFDLYVSEDGVNFKAITLDGFGDPYNHGLRVFANTESGLAIGTANPFYAAQVWMLTDSNEHQSNSFTEELIMIFSSILESIISNIKKTFSFLVFR